MIVITQLAPEVGAAGAHHGPEKQNNTFVIFLASKTHADGLCVDSAADMRPLIPPPQHSLRVSTQDSRAFPRASAGGVAD